MYRDAAQDLGREPGRSQKESEKEVTLIIDEPTPEQQTLEVIAASDWRTDRVNVIVCGEYDTGKTDFAARFPRPVILDTGEQGALTIRKMLAEGRLKNDVPIVKTTSFADALSVVASPRARLGDLFRGTKWEGYEKVMASLAVDTVSTLEEWCTAEILTAKGWNDLSDGGAGGGWSALKRKMGAFFRAAWNLPINTVLLSHVGEARTEVRDKQGKIIMKAKAAGPLLSGALVKTAPALADFMLYFAKEFELGGETFVGYAGENPYGFPTKNRLRGLLPARIVEPSYEHIRAALDVLEAKATFKQTWGT